MQILEPQKIYSNFGTMFSKVILLKNSFENSSFLWIVESEKNIKNYKKISDFLKFDIFELSNFSDFVNAYYNKNNTFVTYKDFFHIELDKLDIFLDRFVLEIQKGEHIHQTNLAKKLSKLHINFSEYEDKNSFNIKGDVFTCIDSVGKKVKISFWGDEIESIFYEGRELQKYYFGLNKSLKDFSYDSNINKNLIEFCKKRDVFTFFDTLDYYTFYDEFTKNFDNFSSFSRIGDKKNSIDLGISELQIHSLEDFKNLLLEKNSQKTIYTKNEKTIKNFLELNNIEGVKLLKTDVNVLKSFQVSIPPLNLPLSNGEKNKVLLFAKEGLGEVGNDSKNVSKQASPLTSSEKTSPLTPLLVGEGNSKEEQIKTNHGKLPTANYTICDDNISRIFIKKRTKKTFAQNLDLFLQIKPGDFIVHIDHGIGIFKSIIEKELAGIKKEYIEIHYQGNDKLFVPITELARVSKYIGSENPKLTKLSTIQWEKKLQKARQDVEKIATELLEIFAKRKMQKGYAFLSMKDEETAFLNSFEYTYTEDQITAINDIYKDMEAEIPMDRLICGDVGFGKTEVAFASIFKSLINEKQAVFIAPLVVLAYEHFEKAKERFANLPFNIEVLTRFESAKRTSVVIEKLKTGKVDLVIGTHKLLSEQIQFKDLGLLVVDEEHKFGVQDKEKIKKLRGNIDILSMSATPIPRSLNMALNGLKEVSMLTTPPSGKQEVATFVSDFNDRIIFEAAKQEFERGGQIFFIHNRVETILGVQSYLEKLLPGKRICVAHGQLPGDKLETTIIDFKQQKYDILLATTVVENGIDFKNVNTIFINDAINFGISQIHQLRGRVGRGTEKGYCYLLFKKDKIKEESAKRLKTIVDYTHLGAGFELAIKDLEIRGGGDILGIRQSGSSTEVGIRLFLEMLENKIEELKSAKPVSNSSMMPQIDLQIEAYLDNEFFTSELDKLNFYRELESINDIETLKIIKNDFQEVNKNFSESTENFFDLLYVKIKARDFCIGAIKKVGINYQIDFDEKTGKTEKIEKFLQLDKDIKFQVVNLKKLRSPIKNFTSTKKFIQYLLQIFSGNVKKEIKLKR